LKSAESSINAFVRKVQAALRLGIFASIRIALDRTALGVLSRIFGFHPWHAAAPLSARPYRRVVADLVNELNPRRVVEVGCGLGSILSLIHAPERYGYDVDEGAIRAARLIRSKGISFIQGDMRTVSQSNIDVLILCNWIHDFSPEQLDSWITPLMSRTSYLLLDAIDSNGPEGYRFKHDFAFLGVRATHVAVRRAPGEGRTFNVYKVAP
jgi:hypothetical protein